MTYDKPTRIPFESTLNNTGIPYAGIGSRDIAERLKKSADPKLIQLRTMMIKAGYYMALLGYCLRSGSAEGPDEYFELGVDLAIYTRGKGEKEIYLPWRGFRENPSHLDGRSYEVNVMKEMIFVASEYHPGWKREKEKLFKENPNYQLEDKLILLKGQKPYKPMMARNVLQIKGEHLDNPVKFVLCWTKDGVISAEKRTTNTGGTGQAIAIASDLGIKVYNLARDNQFKIEHNEEESEHLHFERIEQAIAKWEKQLGVMPDPSILPYKLETKKQNYRSTLR